MRQKSILFSVLIGAGVLLQPPLAASQVFEVIHPDVVQGGFELEVLNGMSVGDVEAGEERSAHEVALGYSITDFWKTVVAIEIANPEDESAEYEGLEWENVFLLPFGTGHNHGADHDHDEHGYVALEAIGIFAALELPNHGGINAAAVEIGPIAEVAFGRLETVVDLLFEFPFEDDAEPGIAYAFQAQYPVMEGIGLGVEAHGGWENAFESDREGQHFAGPALFGELDLGRGRILEPRLAVLFGLTENAPDAVISFNLELKF